MGTFTLPRFETYQSRIKRLPRSIVKHHILNNRFCLESEGQKAVYYAPFEGPVNGAARILIVGLTPGWTQTKIAYEQCSAVLHDGGTKREALSAVRTHAPFAGLRCRLCRWLDELRVPERLGIDSTETLFCHDRSLLQTTSLIRYPVFVGKAGANYPGGGSHPIESDLLWSIIEAAFVPRLHKLPDALVVPLGVAVATALRELGVPAYRCLYGFPHPARSYPYGDRDFLAKLPAMRRAVSRFPW
ncbi:MAG: hypothetical protein WB116_10305 [Candidatus Dormiibacterota bacterium]